MYVCMYVCINNNKSTTIQFRLKAFQACFCCSILSNCEIWGHCFPKSVLTLYNRGLELALDVRISTPTSLIFIETRQPAVLAIVRKRQLKFCQNLRKEEGTELHKLIVCAEKTRYIQHYTNPEKICITPNIAFDTINNIFYDDLTTNIKNCKKEQSKLNNYKNIYGVTVTIPSTSLTLTTYNEEHRRLITRYIVSSHNLASESSRWLGIEKICKQCTQDAQETLEHFIFNCPLYTNIRRNYNEYPQVLKGFFKWEHCGKVIAALHSKRHNK